MSETISFEMALLHSEAEDERRAIEDASGTIERVVPFEPPRDEIDTYARAHFEPMTVIFASATLVVLAERIAALIKDVSHSGLIVEKRDEKWRIRENPSLRCGKVLVLHDSGASTLDLSQHDSKLLEKILDLLKSLLPENPQYSS